MREGAGLITQNARCSQSGRVAKDRMPKFGVHLRRGCTAAQRTKVARSTNPT